MRIMDVRVFFLDKSLLYFCWHVVMNTDTLDTSTKTEPTLCRELCFVSLMWALNLTPVLVWSAFLSRPRSCFSWAWRFESVFTFPLLFGLIRLVEFLVNTVRFFTVKMFFQMHSYVIFISSNLLFLCTLFFICCGLWGHLGKSYEIRNKNSRCLGFKT